MSGAKYIDWDALPEEPARRKTSCIIAKRAREASR